MQPFIFQTLLQHGGGYRVQLALHQALGEMHYGDFHTAQLEAVRGFQAEQAAADHDRVFETGAGFYHRIYIVNIAEADHAVEIIAGHRQNKWIRTGG